MKNYIASDGTVFQYELEEPGNVTITSRDEDTYAREYVTIRKDALAEFLDVVKHNPQLTLDT